MPKCSQGGGQADEQTGAGRERCVLQYAPEHTLGSGFICFGAGIAAEDSILRVVVLNCFAYVSVLVKFTSRKGAFASSDNHPVIGAEGGKQR